MEIKGLKIGLDHPTRIIAELGTLHLHQSKDEILTVIGQCIDAGADLVKLQFINPDTAWWATEEQLLRYRSLFSQWTIPRLNDLMITANKTFKAPVFASIFDPVFLNIDMPLIKLGYKVKYNQNLALAAFNDGRPVIISCDTFSRQLFPNHPRTKYLWVDPSYPMIENLNNIAPIDHIFFHGYSCHTNNLNFINTLSKNSRPELLELHVQGKGASGSDTAFALTLDQLKEVVTSVKA